MVYTADIPQQPHSFLRSLSQHPSTSKSISTHSKPASSMGKLKSTLRKSSSPTLFLKNIPLPVAKVLKYLTSELLGTRTYGSKDRKSTEDTNYYLNYLTPDHLKTSYSYSRQYLNLCEEQVNKKMWGSAKQSNLDKSQTIQSRILRKIPNAPYYVSNYTLHKDIITTLVHDRAIVTNIKWRKRLSSTTLPSKTT
jgi:hypothetical protein